MTSPTATVSITGGDFVATALSGGVDFALGLDAHGHAVGGQLGCSNQCFIGLYWPGAGGGAIVVDPNFGSTAQDINDHEQVVGARGTATIETVGYLWTPGGPILNMPFLPGHTASTASALNNDAWVVGGSGPGSITTAVLWKPVSPGSGSYSAFALPSLGGCCSEAKDINESGQIVGYSTAPSGQRRAVLWQPTIPGGTSHTVHDLGTLGGATGWAEDLNEAAHRRTIRQLVRHRAGLSLDANRA